ncbi:hypothetical protein QBC35DRAFT_451591 [Podospora australis]|uniref:Uncharacterized protein n=1 Tax=Podospora australis TaxID=1536484 RepID=A0AAN6WU00_9PEZI|nr:hypothetical protein QBC35DRAFT_451591 [Podospora australis]
MADRTTAKSPILSKEWVDLGEAQDINESPLLVLRREEAPYQVVARIRNCAAWYNSRLQQLAQRYKEGEPVSPMILGIESDVIHWHGLLLNSIDTLQNCYLKRLPYKYKKRIKELRDAIKRRDETKWWPGDTDLMMRAFSRNPLYVIGDLALVIAFTQVVLPWTFAERVPMWLMYAIFLIWGYVNGFEAAIHLSSDGLEREYEELEDEELEDGEPEDGEPEAGEPESPSRLQTARVELKLLRTCDPLKVVKQARQELRKLEAKVQAIEKIDLKNDLQFLSEDALLTPLPWEVFWDKDADRLKGSRADGDMKKYIIKRTTDGY